MESRFNGWQLIGVRFIGPIRNADSIQEKYNETADINNHSHSSISARGS